MTVSACSNFEYRTEPAAEATKLILNSREGSDVEVSSAYEIRSPNAVVDSEDVVEALSSVPRVSTVKFGFRQFVQPGGGTVIETAREHSGLITLEIDKTGSPPTDQVVSEIFHRIYELLTDHGEQTRRVELAAEEYAVSRFEEDR